MSRRPLDYGEREAGVPGVAIIGGKIGITRYC